MPSMSLANKNNLLSCSKGNQSHSFPFWLNEFAYGSKGRSISGYAELYKCGFQLENII